MGESLYRQAVILERDAGLEIGRATLDGWVMRVGELLQPVIAAMRKDLLNASYLAINAQPLEYALRRIFEDMWSS